jgi:hypothetical protein
MTTNVVLVQASGSDTLKRITWRTPPRWQTTEDYFIRRFDGDGHNFDDVAAQRDPGVT